VKLLSFAYSSEAGETSHTSSSRDALLTVARTGILVGDEVLDLTSLEEPLPGDMIELLATGGEALSAAFREATDKARRANLAEVRVLAPVPRPGKFLGIGLNYASHVAEQNIARPADQLWFNKQVTCVIGDKEAIEIPRVSSMVDYEGELAFVIGTRCRHVMADEAPRVIAGYTIVNDVSVRDWQWRTPTMTMGKSFDTHGPMGPWIVTPDELGDPHDLSLRTWVNNDLRQDANTSEMIFNCYEMVEHLSTAFTLEPGDVITTGTPAGVGMGRKPPAYLVAGDEVKIAIEGIGTLTNPVVQERPWN
jgi:2-keto-4-pentenoate hydratase/2-oxohepta-3-ene-1,7-dioic acid hydratase in catechol pathway